MLYCLTVAVKSPYIDIEGLAGCFFLRFNLCVLTRMNMHYLHAWGPQRLKESTEPPGIGIVNG